MVSAIANAPATAVAPVSGSTYLVENLAYGHYMNNDHSKVADSNPILGWSKPATPGDNEKWIYLTYPSSDGDTVFTLQSLYTSENRPNYDGRGGYMRTTVGGHKVIQDSAPHAWKLIEVAPNTYKFTPYEDAFSLNGTLVVTDVSETIHSSTPTDNQLAVVTDTSQPQQFWTFSPL
ncbi:hypothetical protein DFH11DRAFT_314799 [Phellopilus nigrolimitatus]|nr:hypothetical protein DFH11DRAFT_314799 [Phellopilus nigrolimitatus]